MVPVVPIVVSTVIFTATAWGVNKIVEKVTGKDIDDNLDSAFDKVIEFVRPSETTSAPAAEQITDIDP